MNDDNKYKSFIFRESWWKIICELPPTQKSVIIEYLCKYVFDNEEPQVDIFSPAGMAIQFIKQQIELDKNKFDRIKERRREAGKKGNEVRWNSEKNVSQNIANIANATKTENNQEDSKLKIEDISEKNIGNSEEKTTENVSQNIAKVANAITDEDKEKNKDILLYSLYLLSQGRPNAYSEAANIYEYYEAMDWTTETIKPNGDKVVKKCKNKVAFLKAGNPKNEQLFAPADGQLLANILSKTGCSFDKKDVVDNFRGFQMIDDETVAFVYTSWQSYQKLQTAFENDQRINSIVSRELQKKYPKSTSISYVLYKK